MSPQNLYCVTTERSLVCDRARLADTTLTRLFGLLGKPPLVPGQGLLILPSSGVHTWGMSSAIDIVALDREQRVIRLCPNVGPWHLRGLTLRTRSVLELPPGQIERSELAIGDMLHFQKLDHFQAAVRATAAL